MNDEDYRDFLDGPPFGALGRGVSLLELYDNGFRATEKFLTDWDFEDHLARYRFPGPAAAVQ
ncbi:hypothetical protein [Spirillospora sp. NPDC047279]|uniref:hypothetical protein n=1 Tax=Spirillospora sp. NPDC047279 TaxID=3155478 RepID=UPI0034011E55